jgi:hypothetical protein
MHAVRVLSRFATGWVALGLGAAFGLSGCSRAAPCGTAPHKPEQIRTVTSFGRVTADPTQWILGRNATPVARFAVAGHSYSVDHNTERLGSCTGVGLTTCFAYVGVAQTDVLAWVLLAQPPIPGKASVPTGELTISDGPVWKVRSSSVVLSDGVELPYGSAFAAKLDQPAGPNHLRQALEGTQVATSLSVDRRTGAVVDASIGGYA